jgi:predicted Zn finger-like uncharacterized protein
MFTRCARCASVFRVTLEQLQSRGGQVRCGVCDQVFDAFPRLSATDPRTPEELAAGAVAARPAADAAATTAEGAPDAWGLDAAIAATVGDDAVDAPAMAAGEAGADAPGAAPPDFGVDLSVVAPFEAAPMEDARPELASAEAMTAIDAVADRGDAGFDGGRTTAATEAIDADRDGQVADAPVDASMDAVANLVDADSESIRAETDPIDAESDPIDLTDDGRDRSDRFDSIAHDGGDATEDAATEALPHGTADPLAAVETAPATNALPAPHASRGKAARRAVPVLAVTLACAAIAQGLFAARGAIAQRIPAARPALVALCAPLGCEVPLPRLTDLLSIEASALQAIDPQRPSRVRLDATLRNRAAVTQAWPLLELTLTDARDAVAARRVLRPDDYLPGAAPPGSASGGFPADGETVLRLELDTGAVPPAGYRLYLFHP